MFLLTDIFDKEKDSFEYNDDRLHVDMSYDNILRLFQLFDDEAIRQMDKIIIALEMLVYEFDLIENKGFDELLELYRYIMKEFLDIDLYSKDKDPDQTLDEQDEDPPIKKVMNFNKDATLIYASFLSEYHIDLFEVQGKMHWLQFSALLSNLGDDTAFKQIVSYRTMEIPSTKEASKEYRDHVIKMKKLYSLEDKEERAKKHESLLDSIASTFKK